MSRLLAVYLLNMIISTRFTLYGLSQMLKRFGKNQTKTFITQSLTKVGIYISMANIIVTIAMRLLNFSVGGAVAYALDKFNKTRVNGRIQF